MKNLIFLAIIILTLFSCVKGFYPVPTKNIKVKDDIAILETDELLLALESDYWKYEPSEINDYYSVFYLTLRNKTNKKISIRKNDFSLLVNNVNQYDVVDKTVLLNLIDQKYYDIDNNFLPPEERMSLANSKMESLSKLENNLFSFGEILPNAQKSGFILFSKIPYRMDSFTFIFKDNKIKFERKK